MRRLDGYHIAQLGSTTTTSDSSSNASEGSATENGLLAYSHCMRSNGVPNYPDPNSNGNLPKGNAQAFGVSTSQYQAADQACGHLLPGSGSASLTQCLMTGDCPRSVVQPALEEGLKFAQCMRSHGVTNCLAPPSTHRGVPPSRSPRRAFPLMRRVRRRCFRRLGIANVSPACASAAGMSRDDETHCGAMTCTPTGHVIDERPY